jgi:predicted RNA-binding protein
MLNRNYWIDLFTGTSWQEFIKAGGKISGFRESRWSTVQKIQPGDYLICYLVGVARFIGMLEVTSKPYKDTTTIWAYDVFPCRVDVKIIVGLSPETSILIKDLQNELSIFKNIKSPKSWSGAVRGSPSKWKQSDGDIILAALLDAKEHPVIHLVDQHKLSKKPQGLKTKIGLVTVPETDETIPPVSEKEELKELSIHTEIQYQILKLGTEMGFPVWAARNDRSREYKGNKFSDIFRLKNDLPLQFDEATTKTIEHIDVLWLKGNAIIAAFEIESTTSIYSGLLRMSDLIAMQPNINIPLYLVAPEEWRDKVFIEVNRPTFSRLSSTTSRSVSVYFFFDASKTVN